MKMEKVNVGMFKLPGLVLDKEEMTEEKIAELDAWIESEQGTGKRMTDVLWSFRNEGQREWFILKWS